MSPSSWRGLCLVAFAAAGCAFNSQPVDWRAQFDPAEYTPYDQPGTSVLAGQAFLRTRGGEVRYGAGSEVYLSPVTSYSKEWWNQVVVRNAKFSSGPDPRASKYMKVAVADGEGRFTFAGLPAGDYFVVSSVYWEVPGGYGLSSTGGRVGRQVHVGQGQQVTLVLNELDSTTAPPPGDSSSPRPGVAAAPAVESAPSSPPRASSHSPTGRSKSELLRFLNLRRALEDLMRVRLITDFQETRSGVLRLVLGEGYQSSQAREYNLERVRRAYAESTNFDTTVDLQLELWQGGQRVGVYTRDGLFLDGR
jgi:hypothetical protein